MPTADRYAKYRADQTTIWVSKTAAGLLNREREGGESASAVLDRMLVELRKARRAAGLPEGGAPRLTRSTAKAPAKAAAKGAARGGAKSAGKAAAKGGAKSAAKAGGRGAAKSAAKGAAKGGPRPAAKGAAKRGGRAA